MSAEALNQIQTLLEQLDQDEQLRLIELVAGRLRKAAASQPEAILKQLNMEAPDADIDRALREIRSEWLTGLEGQGPKGE